MHLKPINKRARCKGSKSSSGDKMEKEPLDVQHRATSCVVIEQPLPIPASARHNAQEINEISLAPQRSLISCMSFPQIPGYLYLKTTPTVPEGVCELQRKARAFPKRNLRRYRSSRCFRCQDLLSAPVINLQAQGPPTQDFRSPAMGSRPQCGNHVSISARAAYLGYASSLMISPSQLLYVCIRTMSVHSLELSPASAMPTFQPKVSLDVEMFMSILGASVHQDHCQRT